MKIDSFLLPLAASKALNETQAVSDTDLLVVNTLQAGYWDALVVDTLTDKLHQVKFEHSYPSGTVYDFMLFSSAMLKLRIAVFFSFEVRITYSADFIGRV